MDVKSELVSLGDVTTWLSGGTPRRSKEDYWKGHIPWISASTLKTIEIYKSDQNVTEEAVSSGSKMAPLDSTLLLVRGSALHNEIRAGLVTKPVCFNQDVKALVPNKKVHPKYLAYSIMGREDDLLRLVSSAGNTAGVLDTKLVQSFKIWLPKLPEQRAITTALSDVDALIGALEKLIIKKRDIKQAAMQQLLTGQTRLPGFHGKWEVKTLGDLFNFYGGYSASRDQLSTEGYCYLHYGDIHGASKTFLDTRTDFQDIPKLNIPLKRVSSGALLKHGDVVFVDASEDDEGTSKHVVIENKDNIPFISGLHTIIAKSKTDDLANEYRRYCFQTADIKKQFLFYAVGTKVSGISKSNISKLTLPVPTLSEQVAIAAILRDMDAELVVLGLRLGKTRALKQGMMQELLTGRIRLVNSSSKKALKC